MTASLPTSARRSTPVTVIWSAIGFLAGVKPSRGQRFGSGPQDGAPEDGLHPSAVEQQVGDEGGPAGLVRRPEAATGVAVEVLEEPRPVTPRRIALQPLVVARDRPAARRVRGRIGQEDRDEPARELVGCL